LFIHEKLRFESGTTRFSSGYYPFFCSSIEPRPLFSLNPDSMALLFCQRFVGMSIKKMSFAKKIQVDLFYRFTNRKVMYDPMSFVDTMKGCDWTEADARIKPIKSFLTGLKGYSKTIFKVIRSHRVVPCFLSNRRFFTYGYSYSIPIGVKKWSSLT